ncbi:hypothetical protein J2T57_002717 [Natronocella acetinitrilica]|uniref:Exonuclease n=1 Tax=Natronocella acetinitrilica TaxID=414046 RepID=A0AAE3G859_9GAMM|nr:3'-5' exoribonuclease [Natronocella acetinitrilica]MCP1675567.1 hypothetical protein [Natronocella acetinitrilica]
MSRFKPEAVELFVSTDVETDGPAPGSHSMLSLASAVFNPEGELVDTFSANLEPLPDATADRDTMAWWAERPEAWGAATSNAKDPATVMADYAAWLRGLPGKPIFLGYPVAFDFPFVSHYLVRFTGTNPFGRSAIDIHSYAMAVLQTASLGRVIPRRMPPHWIEGDSVASHIALDDATRQGLLFIRMYQENLRRDSGDSPDAESMSEYPEW